MSGPICAVCGQHGDRPLFDHTEHFGHAFDPAIPASRVRALAEEWERQYAPSDSTEIAVGECHGIRYCGGKLRALLREHAPETGGKP